MGKTLLLWQNISNDGRGCLGAGGCSPGLWSNPTLGSSSAVKVTSHQVLISMQSKFSKGSRNEKWILCILFSDSPKLLGIYSGEIIYNIGKKKKLNKNQVHKMQLCSKHGIRIRWTTTGPILDMLAVTLLCSLCRLAKTAWKVSVPFHARIQCYLSQKTESPWDL